MPGANFGTGSANNEAVHGSAPDIAGKDMANPTAVLRSAILMLHHLGEHEAANHINAALAHVYTERKHVTRDVGGTAGTSEFADAVIAALQTIPVPTKTTSEAEL